MGDFNYLCCNIDQCKILLTDKVWITRCLHIFCPEHGHSNFSNKSQVNCPVCNEINVKETDVAFCEVNPSAMVLAGLSPERAITLAMRAVKLWRYQAEAEHAYELTKLNNLTQKYNNNKYLFQKNINKIKIKYDAEIAGLKAYYEEIGEKLRKASEELQETKRHLKKYQIAYNSLRTQNQIDNYEYRTSPQYDLTLLDDTFFTPITKDPDLY